MRHKVKHVHFVGIGGSGMSGIAEVMLNLGYQVSGSDLADNTATRRLQELGATVCRGHAAEYVAGADAVVTSSAVNESNPELIAARARRIPVVPRAPSGPLGSGVGAAPLASSTLIGVMGRIERRWP